MGPWNMNIAPTAPLPPNGITFLLLSLPNSYKLLCSSPFMYLMNRKFSTNIFLIFSNKFCLKYSSNNEQIVLDFKFSILSCSDFNWFFSSLCIPYLFFTIVGAWRTYPAAVESLVVTRILWSDVLRSFNFFFLSFLELSTYWIIIILVLKYEHLFCKP